MVLFGGIPVKNNQVINGGVAEHSTEEWLKKAKEKGIEFINISPLRSDIPKFTDAKWLQIRPNSDTALMLALAHTIVSKNLIFLRFESKRKIFLNPATDKIAPGSPAPVPISKIDRFLLFIKLTI